MYIESTIDESRLALVELSDTEFKKNKVEHSDIFFTRSSLVKEGIACSNVYDGNSEDVTFDGHLIRMRPKKNVLNHIFANYLLKTREVRKQLVARGKTATMTTIGQADIAAVLITFPEIPEQTKIANFLTAVDEKIVQLARKLDLLTQYKKGVMQQIFSQALRFKDDDGREFPEWKEEMLLNLSKAGFSNGVFNDPNKTGRGYKLVNVLDMYIDTAIDETRLTLVDLSDAEFERNKVCSGDVFFTRSSLVKEGIAYSNVYLGCSADVTFDGHLIRMTPKMDLVIPVFLNYLLRTSKVRKQLVSRGKTATMTTIGQADIADVVVTYPLIAEQTKIANFLTAIDDKITSAQAQLAAAKQYKQGLLQQLFV